MTADNYFKAVVRRRIVGIEGFCSDDLGSAERAYERAARTASLAGGAVVVLRVPEELEGAPPFTLVRSAMPCPPGHCLWVRDEGPLPKEGRAAKSRPGWTCTRCNRHRPARRTDDEEE